MDEPTPFNVPVPRGHLLHLGIFFTIYYISVACQHIPSAHLVLFAELVCGANIYSTWRNSETMSKNTCSSILQFLIWLGLLGQRSWKVWQTTTMETHNKASNIGCLT